MASMPDVVRDSKLDTRFISHDTTVHTDHELDEAGGRPMRREEYWKRERLLGRGGFGDVQLEVCLAGRRKGTLRAVKIVRKQSQLLDLNRELEATAKFSHRRYQSWFVKSFGWFETADSISIAMEYCPLGDLHHYLLRHKHLPSVEVQQVVYQILEGLHEMHKNDFSHRDMKPANILIKSSPPSHNWWVVLADFGISKRVEEKNGPTTAIQGTPGFMAPEVRGLLDDCRPRSVKDFQAADMWAIGEMASQMLTGKPTFQARQLFEYCMGFRDFSSEQLQSSTDEFGFEFVSKLMKVQPGIRITAEEALHDPWLESQKRKMSTELLNFSDLSLEKPIPQDMYQRPASTTTSPDVVVAGRWTTAGKAGTDPPIMDLAMNYEITEFEETPWKILKGHTTAVISVKISPDGQILASGSADTTVRLWDSRSGLALERLQAHSRSINSVAISPDGTWLASSSDDATIRLWDIHSLKMPRVLEDDTGGVSYADFLLDSKILASASNDGYIRLWDVRSRTPLRKLNLKSSKYRHRAALSPDGILLASTSVQPETHSFNHGRALGSVLQLWDIRFGSAPVHEIETSQRVWNIVFSPDGKLLASEGDFGTHSQLSFWEMGSYTEAWSYASPYTRGSFSGAFAPNGRMWAVVGSSTITLLEIGSGKVLQILRDNEKFRWLRPVAFSPDGSQLASGSSNGSILLFQSSSAPRK